MDSGESAPGHWCLRRLRARRKGVVGFPGLGGFVSGRDPSGRALPRCLVLVLFFDAKPFRMVDGPVRLSDRKPSTATGLTAPKSKLGGSLLVSSVSRSRHHRAWELLVKGKVEGWRASPAVLMWRRRNDLPLPDSSPTWGGAGFPLGSNVVGCRHLFPPFLPSGSPFPHHYPSLLIIILPSPQSY